MTFTWMLVKKNIKLAFVGTILLLLLAGCGSRIDWFGTNTQEAQQTTMVTEHIKVDDEVIDKGNPFKVIEPVWWTADIYDGEAQYDTSLAGFSREQRLLFAVRWYVAEVNNGGHDQFYFNSTGIVWKDALAGLREMGVGEVAEILAESAKRLGGNPSLNRKTRWKQLDTLDPNFDDLDTRFYDLENEVDLDAVMSDYIMKHRSSFYYEGDVEKPKLPDLSPED